MVKSSGLGKGLDSLIPNGSAEVEQEEQISLADLLTKENEESESTLENDVEDVWDVKQVEEFDSIEKSLDADDEEVEKESKESREELEDTSDEKDNLKDVYYIDENDNEILIEDETSEASEKTTKIKEEVKNIGDNQESTKNIEVITNENDVDVFLSRKDEENVYQVIEIVESNPRITLWSARSAAVLRYLRKTEPEFSISNEASKLIEKALAEKYPEIWTLFDHL